MQARGKPHRWFLSPGGKATGIILLALCTPIPFARSAEVRTWTDITGQYETRAKFLGFSDGQVRLQKEDGTEITLPLARLSEKDQTFVTEQADDAPQGRSSGWKLLRNTSTGEEQISKVLGSVRVAGRRRLQVQEQKTGSKTWIWADEWAIGDFPDGSSDSPVSAPSSSPAISEPQASLAPSVSRRPVGSPTVAQVLAVGSGTDFSQAEKNALAQALERTIGVMVDAETIVRDDQLVRDEILTYTKGYIQEYSVLRSWQQDGITHVEVFARVSVSKLTERLKVKAASEQELDGRLMQVQVELEQQYEKNACEMFRKAVADFTPDKVFKLAVADKPDGERTDGEVTLTIRYTVTADLNAWENIYRAVKPLLERICLASTRVRFPEQNFYDMYQWLYSQYKALQQQSRLGPRLALYGGGSRAGDGIYFDVYLCPDWLSDELYAVHRQHLAYQVQLALLDDHDRVVAKVRARPSRWHQFNPNEQGTYGLCAAPLPCPWWDEGLPPGYLGAPFSRLAPDSARKQARKFSLERATSSESTEAIRLTVQDLGCVTKYAATWTR